jgi:hypothetical protein
VDDPKDNGPFTVTVQETQYTLDVGVTDFPISAFNVCSAKDPTPTGTISLSTSSLDFGNVALKQNASLDLTITNTGDAPLKINQLSPAPKPFSQVAENCKGKTIAAGGNCKVTYKFSPTAAKSFTNTITVSSNDPSHGSTVVTLKGTGGISTIPPVVQSLSATDLGVGSKLTITGHGFGSAKKKVNIGTKLATIVSWNDSSIVVKLPSLVAKEYAVTVVLKPNLKTAAGKITLHKPEVSSVDPGTAFKGSEVTINGNYFGIGVKPKVLIKSGRKSTAATVIAGYSDTSAKIKIPKLSKAGNYQIVVSNSAGTSNSINFTYQ